MFTLAEIETAHSKIESGKDFPKFAAKIKELGVSSIETFVEDGSTIYKGEDDSQVTAAQQYAPLLIYGIVNPPKFFGSAPPLPASPYRLLPILQRLRRQWHFQMDRGFERRHLHVLQP